MTTTRRLLRLSSHAAHARYLAELPDDPCGWIAWPRDIPSPFACGPSKAVWSDPKRGPVVVIETAHRTFDVYAVTGTIYPTDDAATDAYIRGDP